VNAHIVGREQGAVERNIADGRELILGGVVRGHVDVRVAVGEGHAGKVPENDHEAPLLVEDIPGLRNALLGLATVKSEFRDNVNTDSKILTKHWQTGTWPEP